MIEFLRLMTRTCEHVGTDTSSAPLRLLEASLCRIMSFLGVWLRVEQLPLRLGKALIFNLLRIARFFRLSHMGRQKRIENFRLNTK
jgi:hypothetical protein